MSSRTYCSSGGSETQWVRQVVHEYFQVVAGEGPLEWLADALVVILECEKAIFECVLGWEVIRGKDFPLDYGEVDFDLVEPTGVYGTVDGDKFGVGSLEALDAWHSSMRGPVVHDPEDASGVAVRGGGHHLIHEPPEGRDAGACFAATEELGAVDVECGKICPGATAYVLMLDLTGRSRLGWQSWVDSTTSLDTGLLVSGKHELVWFQGNTFPLPGVEVEDAASLDEELRIPWEDPAPMLPGTDGVFVQPAPYRLATDSGYKTEPRRLSGDVRRAQTGQREAELGRKLTGEGLDLNHDLWGGKPGVVRAGLAPRGQVIV